MKTAVRGTDGGRERRRHAVRKEWNHSRIILRRNGFGLRRAVFKETPSAKPFFSIPHLPILGNVSISDENMGSACGRSGHSQGAAIAREPRSRAPATAKARPAAIPEATSEARIAPAETARNHRSLCERKETIAAMESNPVSREESGDSRQARQPRQIRVGYTHSPITGATGIRYFASSDKRPYYRSTQSRNGT